MSSQRVVVVDDSVTNLKILRRLAATLGDAAAVHDFVEAAPALAACRERPPDLVIVAGELAEGDAAHFIGRLRDLPGCAELPAIVVAAPEARDCIARALSVGAADYLTSPVDPQEFRVRVRNLLSLRRYAEAAAAAPAADHGATAGSSRAHERLLQVIDAVPAMVCATDREGRYIFCNRHFAAFVGMRPGRLIGKHPLEAHDDALARRLGDADARLLAGDAQPGVGEEEILDPAGERRTWLTTKALFRADGGDAMVVTVALDVTAHKATERDLVATKEQAEVANRAKTEFLANMSHELRTPLNAIIGFSQLMAGEMLGPIGVARYADYANDILVSAEHLLGIINDILDMSKLETGRLDLVEEAVDLTEAVAEIVALVEAKARAAGIRIVQRGDGELPWLRADPRKVKQIVLNLVTNAIKFSRADSEVEIVLRNDAGSLGVVIIDRGIGMDPDEVQLAMTRFGQVTSPWVREHAGTGLGLPLAIGLTELHGGRLTVHSIKGVGTTVVVAFPPERSQESGATRAAASRTAS